MHASGPERTKLRFVGRKIIQKIVAALMKRHALLGDGRDIELKLGAIVSVPNLMSEMVTLIESEAEAEAEAIVELDVVRFTSEYLGGANSGVREQGLTEVNP